MRFSQKLGRYLVVNRLDRLGVTWYCEWQSLFTPLGSFLVNKQAGSQSTSSSFTIQINISTENHLLPFIFLYSDNNSWQVEQKNPQHSNVYSSDSQICKDIYYRELSYWKGPGEVGVNKFSSPLTTTHNPPHWLFTVINIGAPLCQCWKWFWVIHNQLTTH